MDREPKIPRPRTPETPESKREPVDMTKLKVGDRIKIKQPGGTSYDTSADHDAGVGARQHDETWIDSTIIRIHTENPDDQSVETADTIRFGSNMTNEFSAGSMWMENGVVYADIYAD